MTLAAKKILVLGATGGVGQHVLTQALESGYDVTVLVRHPEKLMAGADRVRILTGDVTAGPEMLATAVAGQDAVIGALGVGNSLKSGGLIQKAAPALVQAMRSQGVHRLVFTSAYGVGATYRDVPLLPRIIMGLLLGDLYRDKLAGEAAITGSDLDWTLVYPVTLTNGPLAGGTRAGERLAISGLPRIARADVATFLLAQVDDLTWLRKCVLIAR